jgi:hypothetical protein
LTKEREFRSPTRRRKGLQNGKLHIADWYSRSALICNANTPVGFQFEDNMHCRKCRLLYLYAVFAGKLFRVLHASHISYTRLHAACLRPGPFKMRKM